MYIEFYKVVKTRANFFKLPPKNIKFMAEIVNMPTMQCIFQTFTISQISKISKTVTIYVKIYGKTKSQVLSILSVAPRRQEIDE